MKKKTRFAVLLVLLLLAGVIVWFQRPASQGTQADAPPPLTHDADDEGIDEIVDSGNIITNNGGEGMGQFALLAPADFSSLQEERWFRSNAGGMALQEIPSRQAALRYEHVLSVSLAQPDELPDIALEFFSEEFFIEVRTLHTDGEETRRQWIFRDENGRSRIVAVFSQEAQAEENGEDQEEEYQAELPAAYPDGFIDVYDEDGFIVEEWRFRSDGSVTKTIFTYLNGVAISAQTSQQIQTEEAPVFQPLFTDHFRYNRDMFLRAVERVYHDEYDITNGDNIIRVSFARNIADFADGHGFIEEMLTEVPDFFGAVFRPEGAVVLIEADERSRVITQVVQDEEGNLLWTIYNTWEGDRIVSMLMIEGDSELLSEFEFDEDGNRIVERNLRNGVLERVVRTEGAREIEDIYLHGVLVLRAVWEDGRIVSEVRMR